MSHRDPFDISALHPNHPSYQETGEDYGPLPKGPVATVDISKALEKIDRKLLPSKLFAAGIRLDRARADFTEIQAKFQPLLKNPHRAVNIQELKDYERDYGHAEERYLKAQKAYAALLELLTGDSAEKVLVRLAA